MQPLLVVFEDLHWSDAETQALLDRLVESLPAAQLVLLVSYRPEYQHGWGSKTSYTEIWLNPLPPASTETFLAALLGNDPRLAPLKTLLSERTAGNPFFLEESVRTLVEMQALVGAPGAYRLAHDLPAIQVPATVQAVLAARIDRLPPEEKQLLQTAAVIGTEVPLPLLQAIAELPEETLRRGLAHLQAAELLYETRLFPDYEYTFTHALTHEVAYGSLLQERRRVLHARIVEALETFAGDRGAEQVEHLAHHAVRGEVWDKALRYCRQAAANAMTRSAYQEATASLQQALAVLSHLPESRDTMEQAVDLHVNLRHVFLHSGQRERIGEHLHAAKALAEALGDQRLLGLISSFMTNYFVTVVGDPDQALASGQRTFALTQALGDFALQIVANFHLGQLYQILGDYHRAVATLKANVTALTGDFLYAGFDLAAPPSVMSRTFLVCSLAELGAFAEGMAYGEEAIRIAEGPDRPLCRAYAYRGVCYLYLRQGALCQAIPVLERALALCQEDSITSMLPWYGAQLGFAYALSGRRAAALHQLEHAMAPDVLQKVPLSLLPFLWGGETYMLLAHLEEASTLADRALGLFQTRKEQGHEAWTLRLLGEIAMHRDPLDIDQAATHYQQALALAQALGMRPLQAHCHRGLGTVYGQRGQMEHARVALSTAIALYREMEMTFWLPQAESALAQVAGQA